MAEGNAAPATPSCRRAGSSSVAAPGGGRCRGCGLGQLVRKLRRQSKAPGALRWHYDPLSYARNFDLSGFGGDDDDDDSSHFYNYTFSSRFVLSASSSSSGGLDRPIATRH